jgi:hypothetical protein
MNAVSKIAAACAGGVVAIGLAAGAAGAAGGHMPMGGMGMPHMSMGSPHMGHAMGHAPMAHHMEHHMGPIHTAHMHPGHDHHHFHHRHGVVFGVGDVYVGDYGYYSCGYEYSRWQATGSPYWRERYYDCVE